MGKHRKGRIPPYVAKAAAAGQEQLVQLVMSERMSTIGMVLDSLFEPDALSEGKIFRLRGAGGATGVVSQEMLEGIAQKVLMYGMEVSSDNPADGEVSADPPQAEGDGEA